MNPSHGISRSEKARIRRIELEKWKEEKARKKLEQKKNKRPPLRPAGKSSIFTSNLSTISKVPKTKSADSKGKTGSNKKTLTTRAKGGSTIQSCVSPVRREPARNNIRSPDSTFSFEDQESRDFGYDRPFQLQKRKSVQFKEKTEEITPLRGRVSLNESPYGSPLANELTKDDIRRRSCAGRTPFSCASSRSGSTPGRRDLPPSDFKNKNDQSFETPNASKIRKKKGKNENVIAFRCSLTNTPLIERDAYYFRERTPKPDNTPIKKTPGRSAIKPKESTLNRSKRKTLTVSFRDDLIKSNPIFSMEKILGEKENMNPTEVNNLMESNQDVSLHHGLSFLDDKYADSNFLA